MSTDGNLLMMQSKKPRQIRQGIFERILGRGIRGWPFSIARLCNDEIRRLVVRISENPLNAGRG